MVNFVSTGPYPIDPNFGKQIGGGKTPEQLLQGEQRDAYLALKKLFDGFGLGSLADRIFKYVQEGYGADTIAILLQDTAEYKQRFAANEIRRKAGLAVLAPAEYLAAESAYRQILSSAGLPIGFYDSTDDFKAWIGADVSPTEIKGRVDLAVAATGQANSFYKGALQQLYGVQEGDITAFFLDRSRAEPILKKYAAAASIGSAALRRGLQLNRADMEEYATMGVSGQQAEEAYSQIVAGFESMLGIANRFGDNWTQRLAEQEFFTPGAASSIGAESAYEKGRGLRSKERALFAGSRGSSVGGLSGGYRQT